MKLKSGHDSHTDKSVDYSTRLQKHKSSRVELLKSIKTCSNLTSAKRRGHKTVMSCSNRRARLGGEGWKRSPLNRSQVLYLYAASHPFTNHSSSIFDLHRMVGFRIWKLLPCPSLRDAVDGGVLFMRGSL